MVQESSKPDYDASHIVSGLPCDSCPVSNVCIQECGEFKRYVSTNSPVKRKKNLEVFKKSIDEYHRRGLESHNGYRRKVPGESNGYSRYSWDEPIKYPDDCSNV